MKNRGFTLIELLGVILIVAIIFIVTFPVINNVVLTSRETVYEKQINTILNGAYDWSLKNISKLPEGNDRIYITLAQLKREGYIVYDISNPNTNERFDDDLVISISRVSNSYKNTDSHSKKTGNYLYTLIINSSSVNKPQIVLEGLTADSQGNYTTILDIGDVYREVDYTATSSDGSDLTDNVVVSMYTFDYVTDVIDTSKSNIYYVSYTVVDKEGNSNTVVRNVIVGDKTAPEITVPESTIITTSITEFDYLTGVTCSDNSGKCSLSYTGEITFGEVGKYVIEYKSADLSGNTSTKKRVITIE